MLFENLMEFAETLSFKDYLRYKIIFCHKVALDVRLMNFLFEETIMFRFQDI